MKESMVKAATEVMDDLGDSVLEDSYNTVKDIFKKLNDGNEFVTSIADELGVKAKEK